MKTTNKLLYLSLSGLMMLASCSNEEFENMGSEEAANEISLVATQGGFNTIQTQSRTQVDRWFNGEQIGTGVKGNGVAMKWIDTDKIGVFGEKVKGTFPYGSVYEAIRNTPLTNTTPTPSHKTKFQAKLVDAGTYWLKLTSAYYPYNEKVEDEGNIPATIPAKQTYTDVASISAYDFKYTKDIVTDHYRPFNQSAKFTQLATLIRFVVDNEAIQQFLKNNKKNVTGTDKLANITMTCGNGQALTGNFHYSLDGAATSPVELTVVNRKGNKTLNVVTNNLTEEIVEKTTYHTAYAIVAPISKTSLDLSFKYGEYTIVLPQIQAELLAGKVYNIGLNAKSLMDAKIKNGSKESGKTDGNEYADGGAAI